MKIIGIIAEYNPFHNGHAYQINSIRKAAGADYIVVAMSGDFVQRGTPAIVDKYVRAQMALSCGADLIIELPSLWAVSSAESFAMAGVTLFDKMGCIDGICFGAETDNLPLLTDIAELLAEEPQAYRDALASYLKKGLPFPAARANALCVCLGDTDALHTLLNEPNNILAIEYLKAIKKRGSSLTPHLIKREGAGYHETDIYNTGTNNAPTASATAIRNALLTYPYQAGNRKNFPSTLTTAMPQNAYAIFKDYLSSFSPLHEEDFSSVLGYLLLHKAKADLADIADSNEDIANRLIKNRFHCSSFREFCTLNKTRDITYTRMNRILLHIILNITDTDYERGKALDYIPYLRILGFRRDSNALLRRIKDSAAVPLLSKLAVAPASLNEDALWMLEKDIFAANLYEQTLARKAKKTGARNEYTRKIIITVPPCNDGEVL